MEIQNVSIEIQHESDHAVRENNSHPGGKQRRFFTTNDGIVT